MRFHQEARSDRYDVIVVGSGMGGLTTAALLSQAGQRVLVVERHDRVGGYAHSFRRRGYRFDSAVHLIGSCEPVPYPGGGIVHQVLDAVGVRDQCDFVRVDPCYGAVLPGLTLRAPCGPEEFVEAHARQFPGEEKGLRDLVQTCLAIREELSRVDDISSPLEAMRTPSRFPFLLRLRRATLATVLDDHLESPVLKAAFASLWPYLGLPPSRASFLYFATMLMSYVADGAWYCRGSFQRLADALAGAVRREGGEVLLRSVVRRIRMEGERAAGVILENGQCLDAPLVVSNADARQTFEELVGVEHLRPRLRRRLRKPPSLSAFLVYLATDLELPAGLAHETFHYTSRDHEAAYRASLAGEPAWFTATIPTGVDPGLAPPGEQLIVLTTLVAANARRWKEAKASTTQRMLELAESWLPGLSSHLRFVEAATPRTMERYTRNSEGAIYGWELSPEQVGPGRLANETPIPGLLLAGHWTQPGGGVVGVVRSGIQTARLALGVESESALWRALG